MIITRSHWLNGLFWCVVVAFMAFKSIEHTVNVHEKGVFSVLQDYQRQSQARLNFLSGLSPQDVIRPPIYHDITAKMARLRATSSPYDYVRLNEALTHDIDKHMGQLNLAPLELASLKKIQLHMKQESLIFQSHATAFNALISRLPYRLWVPDYPLIPLPEGVNIQGVIVER
ncbi:MAG: hypothetical protein ACO3K7_03105 [Candidatus Marinamargulisbacteria bacterium]